MRYLDILQHTDTFDEALPEMQRLAIRLAVMVYRASDLAVSKHFADNYKG